MTEQKIEKLLKDFYKKNPPVSDNKIKKIHQKIQKDIAEINTKAEN